MGSRNYLLTYIYSVHKILYGLLQFAEETDQASRDKCVCFSSFKSTLRRTWDSFVSSGSNHTTWLSCSCRHRFEFRATHFLIYKAFQSENHSFRVWYRSPNMWIPFSFDQQVIEFNLNLGFDIETFPICQLPGLVALLLPLKAINLKLNTYTLAGKKCPNLKDQYITHIYLVF